MPGIDDGLKRGFGMVIEAFIVAALWTAFLEGGLVPYSLFILFNIGSIVGLVFLIDKTKYWSFGYLAGWIIGLFLSLDILIQTEFLGLFDLLLYAIVAAVAVYIRVKIHI